MPQNHSGHYFKSEIGRADLIQIFNGEEFAADKDIEREQQRAQ
jgi:hypothetical protein